MSRVAIDAGFRNSDDTCTVEVASMHFLQDVVWPPTSPILPLSDFLGWAAPQYYTTIQAADLDGDGAAEILGRAAGGLFAWKLVAGTWITMLGSLPFGDATPPTAPQIHRGTGYQASMCTAVPRPPFDAPAPTRPMRSPTVS